MLQIGQSAQADRVSALSIGADRSVPADAFQRGRSQIAPRPGLMPGLFIYPYC